MTLSDTPSSPVALVAVIVCVVLMVMLRRVGNELETVREDSRTVQEGLSLALSVREHYVHEAHTVIRADRQQVQPHRDWIVRLRARVADLEPRVPAGERDRLDHLLAASERLFEHDHPPTLRTEHERCVAAVGQGGERT